jgi:large repetitive protein
VTATVNGCTSPIGTDTVQVTNQPAASDAGPDAIICAGNQAQLNGTITGGSISGIWSTSGSGIFSSSTDLKASYTPSPADTAAGTVTLTLTTTNTGACPPSSSSMVLTITDAPTAFAGVDATICSFDSLQLNGSIGVVTTGVWSTSGSGTFSPSATDLNAIYKPSAADIAKRMVVLTLTTTGTGSCKVKSDSMILNIIPAPKVDLGYDRFVLQGESVVLQPTITGVAVSYQWSPPLWLSTTTQRNTVSTPAADIAYALTVTGPGGCAVTDSVKITVLPPPVIPNVFSPNGDGTNDTWVVRALEKYPNCVVQIFTRYGQKIYHSNGYKTPWDGTHNGKPMPVGTYYYVIEPGNGRPRLSGYVVILR